MMQLKKKLEKLSPQEKKALKQKLQAENQPSKKGVAIIGVACRFPGGVTNLEEYWKLLESPRCVIQDIPPSRFEWPHHFKRTNQNQGAFKAGLLEHIDCFDADFFSISPAEAQLMDPQQRIILELSWEVIENAGYRAEKLKGTPTGVFVGICHYDYRELLAKAKESSTQILTGTFLSILTNRLSFYYDFHGPSQPIDTACSSSLVAVHEAAESILTGKCQYALAGGVNIICSPTNSILFSHAGMLSKQGACRTFDKNADGYIRGEGAGLILLKDLELAEKDKDSIYGVIRGSAINHGGHANSLTAPNPQAQSALIINAYQQANCSPYTVTYIETHGTGTELGDPIEIQGLQTAFNKMQEYDQEKLPTHHCGIGSVKPIIGHLESASGIAGLLKILASFQHQSIPGSYHFEEINPYIQLDETPFYLNQTTQHWDPVNGKKEGQLLRRAGVSSFGFGGTNAHVIVEDYIPKGGKKSREDIPIRLSSPVIIVLSARNKDRLHEYVKSLLNFIQQFSEPNVLEASQISKDKTIKPAINLVDLAYTLQVGREAMEERLGLIVCSAPELQEKLQAFLDEKENIEKIYYGKIKRKKESLTAFTGNEDVQKAIKAWISKGEEDKLLDLWVKGHIVDWDKLYGDNKPQRIRVPTYPFAKERYWIEQSEHSDTVCIAMREFSSHISAEESESIIQVPATGTLAVKSIWREKPLNEKQKLPEYRDYRVYLCGFKHIISQELQNQAPHLFISELGTERQDLAEQFSAAAVQLFEDVQRLLQDKPQGHILLQVIVPSQGPK
ncbi:MAG: beta-ketoacyl synthase N-terminal-like domain-containing protein, partial [Waddliaceae bacterium]